MRRRIHPPSSLPSLHPPSYAPPTANLPSSSSRTTSPPLLLLLLLGTLMLLPVIRYNPSLRYAFSTIHPHPPRSPKLPLPLSNYNKISSLGRRGIPLVDIVLQEVLHERRVARGNYVGNYVYKVKHRGIDVRGFGRRELKHVVVGIVIGDWEGCREQDVKDVDELYGWMGWDDVADFIGPSETVCVMEVGGVGGGNHHVGEREGKRRGAGNVRLYWLHAKAVGDDIKATVTLDGDVWLRPPYLHDKSFVFSGSAPGGNGGDNNRGDYGRSEFKALATVYDVTAMRYGGYRRRDGGGEGEGRRINTGQGDTVPYWDDKLDGKLVRVDGWVFIQLNDIIRSVSDLKENNGGVMVREMGLGLKGKCSWGDAGDVYGVVYDGFGKGGAGGAGGVVNKEQVVEAFKRGKKENSRRVELGYERGDGYKGIGVGTNRCGIYLMDARDEVYNMMGVGRTEGSCVVLFNGDVDMMDFLSLIGFTGVVNVQVPRGCGEVKGKGIDVGRCERDMGGEEEDGVVEGRYRVGMKWLEGNLERIVRECREGRNY